MLSKLANTNLLGWDCTGDIGGFTAYYSERRKIVIFPRSPPLNPPTPKQEAVRDFFRDVATWWRSCPPQYRTGCQHLATACGLNVTGYNVATHVCRTGDAACWETLCKQSGLNMECPPHIPIETPS